ncbi:hypothetical protein GGR57DRAFT_385803 [Xylariaceae sp. FL1272]|nr:hypothetical protein GGR57DRAFT_385803 [Xylariaceae sp. FL1272]
MLLARKYKLILTVTDDVLGRHAWNIPITAIHPSFFQYSLAAGSLYNVSAGFTKISILALYFRLFSPSTRARVFIWVGMVTVAISYLSLTAALRQLRYVVATRPSLALAPAAQLTLYVQSSQARYTGKKMA